MAPQLDKYLQKQTAIEKGLRAKTAHILKT